MKISKYAWSGIITVLFIMCCLLPSTADANVLCRDIGRGLTSEALGEEFPELYRSVWLVSFGSTFPGSVLIGADALGEEFPEFLKLQTSDALGEEFPEKMEQRDFESLGEEFPE